MAKRIQSQKMSFIVNLYVSQGDSAPVYDNIFTVPTTPDPVQKVTADYDNNDDIQYASVQFKPAKKQQEMPSQEEEEVEYASIQLKKHKSQTKVSETPLSVPPQKETQKSPRAATQWVFTDNAGFFACYNDSVLPPSE